MNRGPDVDRVAVISTAHVSLETSELLGDDADCVGPVLGWEYGWMVWVPTDMLGPGDAYPDMPEDLKTVLNWAQERNFEWVRSDRDGPLVESLRNYDW